MTNDQRRWLVVLVAAIIGGAICAPHQMVGRLMASIEIQLILSTYYMNAGVS